MTATLQEREQLGIALFVDDREDATRIYRHALEQRGFQVEYCDNVDAALETAERLADQIRAVVLDVVMPPGQAYERVDRQHGYDSQHTGRLLYEDLSRRCPDAAFVILTAHAEARSLFEEHALLTVAEKDQTEAYDLPRMAVRMVRLPAWLPEVEQEIDATEARYNTRRAACELLQTTCFTTTRRPASCTEDGPALVLRWQGEGPQAVVRVVNYDDVTVRYVSQGASEHLGGSLEDPAFVETVRGIMTCLGQPAVLAQYEACVDSICGPDAYITVWNGEHEYTSSMRSARLEAKGIVEGDVFFIEVVDFAGDELMRVRRAPESVPTLAEREAIRRDAENLATLYEDEDDL